MASKRTLSSGTSNKAGGLYAGVMSGTSADGVDAVLADFSGSHWQVLGHTHLPFSGQFAVVREEILALSCAGGNNELHRSAQLSNTLATLYARATRSVLAVAGVSPQAVQAVGVHGQTVRHLPQPVGADSDFCAGYTLQLNNPALVAEKTGMTVVADFRSADVAAGGQGAPLAPLFHQAWLHSVAAYRRVSERRRGGCTAVLNLGGIANVTVLDEQLNILYGFDTGPANVLLDAWVQQHLHRAYDENGVWAASGKVNQRLLEAFLTEPFFAASAPKSTGRDLFDRRWLMRHLRAADCWQDGLVAKAEDIQATLLELTARSVSEAISACLLPSPLARLLLCGGGAHNTALRLRLADMMPEVEVLVSDDFGLSAQQVEAVAFAWLAKMRIEGRFLPLPAVTGAKGRRVLGAVYPAGCLPGSDKKITG